MLAEVDPRPWGEAVNNSGSNGLVVLCLVFALLVVVVFAIAWVYVGHGIRIELHGLRVDLRLFQRGDELGELPPLPRLPGPLKKILPPPAEPRDPRGSDVVPPSRKAGRPREHSRP